MRQKPKNEKTQITVEGKSEKRETRDESFYIPPAARLSTLFFRSAPFKPAHPLSARRALLLTSPCVFGHPACKPRLPWRRQKVLALPLRKPLPSPPAAEGITH